MATGHNDIRTPLDDDFDTAARALLKEWHVPGMSIAVIDGDHTFAKGYGIASFPSEKVTPETLFFTASTTKSFTAAAIQLLIEEEALNPPQHPTSTSKPLTWDTLVSSVLPDDFVVSDAHVTTHATLEDLACHRTGMPDHENSFPPKTVSVGGMVRMLRDLPMKAESKGKYIYNNMMYTTLSHIVKRRTKQGLGVFLKERIWGPLGMDSTFWTVPDVLAAEQRGEVRLARGYCWDKETGTYLQESIPDFPAVSGSGAIISSVLDYTKYLRCMLAHSPPLSPAAHANITTPRIEVPRPSNAPFAGTNRYALGWFVDEYRGEKIVWHTGGWTGYGALMCFVPGRNWGVVMAGNTARTSNYVQLVLWFRLLDLLLGTPESEKEDWNQKCREVVKARREANGKARERLYPSLSVSKQKKVMELELEEYAGTYTHLGYGDLVFVVQGAGLVADRQEMEIAMDVRLEHVEGEKWLAYLEVRNRDKCDVQVVRAEFEAKDGRSARCGIEFEGKLEGEKIWFVRNKAV